MPDEKVKETKVQTKPDAEYLEKLRIVKLLLAERFLYLQSSFSIVNGRLSTSSYWTIRNQSTRDNPQKELPAMFCPITGFPLNEIDLQQLESL